MEQLTPENIKKAKETFKDNAKVNEAIDKIRKSPKFMSTTLNYVKSDQNLQRNMEQIKRDMMASGEGVMGTDIPLKQRKKMARKQEMIKSMAKQGYQEGDIGCICMLPNGKTSQTRFNTKDLDDDKWAIQPAFVAGVPFFAICNANIITGVNKLATRFIDLTTYGPVIFMMLTPELEPTDIGAPEFKKLLIKEAPDN